MYSMTNLTPRRTAILTFIRDRIAQQGQPPASPRLPKRSALPRAASRVNTWWR